ncbi:MFS transporter [Fluviispira multicolorata]|uniref:MFS transporter n=1 Tax=Fluviispira multicolorata TaxID=2654512 RepID=A0A833JDA1_9BACT|nr:MFS transporter [Fluviispira multicolorata]KAB8031753.1 MFS transporter [Fluviispira multicolorata]
MKKSDRLVITASSLGTVFEWYDFYLYGSLAVFFGTLFFPKGNDTAAFLASLATFGAGFAVRPFGALIFGRIGDLVGRKYTFLITIIVMGLSTAFVGLLPTYEDIGILAPILLTFLRLAQGLALGGEYGGAATFVAEHSEPDKRGSSTSWIQTTATLGFLLSLGVILTCRLYFGENEFKAWGWRIPFLVSVILLLISVYIRLKLHESPLFLKMQSAGKLSKSPLKESFAKFQNLKIVLLALFGATAGQGVIWYTGQFYALFFLQNTLKIDFQYSYILISASLIIATPFFIIFGKLSDKIGRKKVMMTGCLTAALAFIPIFKGLTQFGNPALSAAVQSSPIVIYSNNCQKDCKDLKDYLSKKGYNYAYQAISQEGLMTRIGSIEVKNFDTVVFDTVLAQAGYPAKANINEINFPMVILLLTILVLFVTMIYGPIAAFLVELFPTQIRYTSMSLPYHIGNGWFGGFLPLIAASVVVQTGNIYAGLYYPIAIALMTFIIGTLFIKETKDNELDRH